MTLGARQEGSVSIKRQQIVQNNCMVAMQAEPPQTRNVKRKCPMGYPKLSGMYPARGALLGCDIPQMTHTQGHGCQQKAFTGLEESINVT